MSANDLEQTRLLREILKWIKFAGIKEVKVVLLSSLNTEQKKIAYYLSDGTRGTLEIAKMTNIASTRTIFDLWEGWIKQGLGESIPVKGGSRFKRSFDLEDFGIAIPQYTSKQEAETSVKAKAEKES